MHLFLNMYIIIILGFVFAVEKQDVNDPNDPNDQKNIELHVNDEQKKM